jgi:thioredoxin-like negative regulator of GroEL
MSSNPIKQQYDQAMKTLRAGDAQEAESWFKKVLKQHEEFPRALEGLGLALLADGKAKKATRYLSRAVE